MIGPSNEGEVSAQLFYFKRTVVYLFRFICICENVKQQREASLHHITILNIYVFIRHSIENEDGSGKPSFLCIILEISVFHVIFWRLEHIPVSSQMLYNGINRKTVKA